MRIGSLFSGYGGLCDLAVAPLLGGTVAWHCDNDPGASKILAHHWPDVPNLGDITKVDWTTVPPVDVITGGFPCQDVSHAGKRLGLRPGTRTGLWSHMAYAIGALRPALVIAENVRGLLSARADGDLEPCPWCLGDERDVVLRALGAVLGDLAELGYDAQWVGLRAADVGAPHGRFRVFVVATDAHRGLAGQRRACADWWSELGTTGLRFAAPDATGDGLEGWWSVRGRTTPRRQGPGDDRRDGRVDWGQYGPAVRRWERLTRPAPAPTEPGSKGQPRLSPRFVEWLMGLPAGHVTDVPGLSRNDQLKALGNGVVPAQAAAAVAQLLDHPARAA